MRRVTALLAVCALLPASAHAYYGNGAGIVSASLERLEQGDDTTTFAAISGDGRYVAFHTRARNFYADEDPDPPGEFRVGGIFRKDVETGELVMVADGDLRSEASDELLLRGALNPSISADGRFVAFSTGWRLVPEDVNDNVDVYVRDMAVPIRATGAFELVSARDGGSDPATYAPSPTPLPGRTPGADLSRGASISADGRMVVFRTVEGSDLPARPAPDTPAFQVWVRDRTAKTTTLVTRNATNGEPAGGALAQAGISADGSTVVWVGQNAQPQTRMLAGENPDTSVFHYLWRRVADGPATSTRRITGLADPDDPACPPPGFVTTNPSATGPCYGPLTDQEAARTDISASLPAMSSDGRRVAFLVGAGLRPTITGSGLDLYLTDMSDGVPRKAGTLELSREGPQSDPPSFNPIESLAMSANGRWLALTSARTRWVLPSPVFVGEPATVTDVRELYAVDLEAMTIERVLRSYTGGEIAGDVSNAPTLSADGERIAFTAPTSDLFFGDANERPDAFWVERREPPQEEPPPPEQPPPPPLVIEGADEPAPFAVEARRGRNGTVRLLVTVPRPGTVAASARARVGRARGRRKPPLRRVAAASARPRVAGRLTLTLRLRGASARALRSQRRLAARASVRFTPFPAGTRRSRVLRVTFVLPRLRRGNQEVNGWRGRG